LVTKKTIIGEKMEQLKMSDDVIGHVAKVLQVALLTGTDVVDNLRMMRLKSDDGVLTLHPVCLEIFDKSLNEMMTEIQLQRAKEEALADGEEMTEKDIENARKMMTNINDEIISALQDDTEEDSESEVTNDEEQADVDQW
tara:strand:+ start:2155 stop:2574 length:420 start_codon:yes stop_codon:yes gene_type:complete